MPFWLVHKGGQVGLLVHRLPGFGAQADRPAGEGAGGFLDVLLGVVALAQGEELEKLPGKVFVGLFGPALCAIQINEHRGVTCHPENKIRPGPQRPLTEKAVLQPEQTGIPHLFLARGKMAVEEQNHFFACGRARIRHPAQPPPPQIGEPFFLFGLEYPQDLPALFLLGLGIEEVQAVPQGPELVIKAGFEDGFRGIGLGRLRRAQEGIGCLPGGHPGKGFGLPGGPAKTGPLQQHRRLFLVPSRGWKGSHGHKGI